MPEGRKGPRNNTFFCVELLLLLGSIISVISVYNHNGTWCTPMCVCVLLLFVENWDLGHPNFVVVVCMIIKLVNDLGGKVVISTVLISSLLYYFEKPRNFEVEFIF